MELLLSEKAVTLYEVLLIVILAALLIRQTKKKSDIRKMREAASKKTRNAELEEMLRNRDTGSGSNSRVQPYDVQYKPSLDTEAGKNSGKQVQIEVHTETSVQKYLFDLKKEIAIGRSGDNDLVLADRAVSGHQCSVYRKDSFVYVRCPASTNPVYIRRGSNKQQLQNQIVKLQNRDILTVGNTDLHILLFEN